ncbi:MAG TPA: amidohydrolase/deacetylase family metallohydrolase [Bacteroidales bacterium]|nr:amidohydrolase/deacetylase family metallohydrolase [Bacteroidales bacterium]HNR40870.1 amidohydrolase/deacetylase family metallohydrolase [Bacteroidales bacterium]HPM17694.1 amidohydrolase/deacetylase family metallohydrolase [Bacteroidales bacterium]HQG78171.1 amidohydrolase/deacetylase family metallohydrolase [Bacteroidales bacterium]
MKHKLSLFILLQLLSAGFAAAQTYSIVIKGGHIIDPKNKINEVMDLAIKDGKIAAVARNIDASSGNRVINAAGMFVTPGIIDMHVHVYYGTKMDQGLMNGPTSVQPDAFSFRAGVTTVVDVGSSGWRSFPDFKRQTIDASRTRVLAFLNIAAEGMRGGPFEQTTLDMNPVLTARCARQYPSDIVGIKLAHYNGHEWAPTDSAVRAGELAKLPVMIDFGSATPPLSLEELFMKHLRPGDIFTHPYAYFPASRETVVDEDGKVKPFVFAAVKRGIKFDLGHGGGSFRWSQAIPSVRQGFVADAISSDLHTGSMNSGMKDMANLMSKFLAMGLDIQEVILRSTWNPAMIINRPDLGNLSIGSEADVAVFSLSRGDFGFLDISGEKLKGDKKFVAELTLRAGNIVWDLNGISAPDKKW